MAQISCLGTTHFKISQDGLDRFTWPLGQAQGVIDFLVERLRPGGLPDVNDFTIVPFHGGSDAHIKFRVNSGQLRGHNRNSGDIIPNNLSSASYRLDVRD